MSDSALGTGWRVYRGRRLVVLDPRRARRRLVVATGAAFVAGAVVVVTQLVWSWIEGPPIAVALVALAGAVAVGSLLAGLVRATTVPGPRRSLVEGRDWRRTERIQAQFAARPPALDPADRDLVLTAVDRARDPLVAVIERTVPLPVVFLAGWVGVVAVDPGSVTDRLFPLLWPLAMAVLQAVTPVTQLVVLGRMDAARRRIDVLDPVASEPEQPTRSRDPRGSKLGLPGD